MRVPVFASPSAGSADLGLVSDRKGVFGGEEEGGGVRSRPGAARTILLSHIISARPSKQPLMVRTFLKVYMELGFYYAGAWSRSMPFLRTVAAAAGGAAQRGRENPSKIGRLTHYNFAQCGIRGRWLARLRLGPQGGADRLVSVSVQRFRC